MAKYQHVTYRAPAGTVVNGVDQAGNVWPKPLVFNEAGLLQVPEDQQDVITALDGAAANGAIEKLGAK